MTLAADPIAHLVSIISTGDLSEAREWAAQHEASLGALRYDRAARAAVAHACNRWGAPMVWPWGDTPRPVAAEQRVLSAIRAGRAWRASEDTVAVIIACGWASHADGVWRAA
jgi:hypothetical protein